MKRTTEVVGAGSTEDLILKKIDLLSVKHRNYAYSPIDYEALRKGDLTVLLSFIEALISRDCSIEANDNRRNNLLHLATMSGNINILKKLARLKLKLIKNYDGFTPLHFAVFGRRADLLKVFMEEGYITLDHALTLHHLACVLESVDITQLLQSLIPVDPTIPTLSVFANQAIIDQFLLPDNWKDNVPKLVVLNEESKIQLLKHIYMRKYVTLEYLSHQPHFKDLISTKQLLKAMREEEYTYIKYTSNYWPCDPPRIYSVSIFENMNRFTIKQEQNIRVYFEGKDVKVPPVGSPSVVNEEIFMKHFNIFTQNLFEGFKWDMFKCFVVGGCVSACLLPLPKEIESDPNKLLEYYNTKYPKSDIDVYCAVSKDEKKLLEFVIAFNDFLNSKNIKFAIMRTTKVIAFVFGHPRRTIQIHIGAWRHIEDILVNCDIDCSAVGFDGKKVIAIPRSEMAFNYRWTMIWDKMALVRGSDKYLDRMEKYAKRGFRVVSIDFTPPEAKNSGFTQLLEDQQAKKEEEEEEDSGIPYGPEWPLKKVVHMVKDEGYVYPDNYGNEESGHEIIDNVEDIYLDYLPNREYERIDNDIFSFEDSLSEKDKSVF